MKTYALGLVAGLVFASVGCAPDGGGTTGDDANQTSGPIPKAGDDAIVSTTAGLNLRDAPALTGNVLLVLPHVALVHVDGAPQNGFAPVTVGTAGAYKGWASVQFLQVVDLASISNKTFCLAHSRAGDIGDIFPVPFCKGTKSVVTCSPGGQRGDGTDPPDQATGVSAVDACTPELTFCMSMAIVGGFPGDGLHTFCKDATTAITCAPGGQMGAPADRPASPVATHKVDKCDDDTAFCIDMNGAGQMSELPVAFCNGNALVTCAPNGERSNADQSAHALSSVRCGAGCATINGAPACK